MTAATVTQFHDVSHWNKDYIPGGPTWAKATQGTDYVDPTFHDLRTATEKLGMPFVAYHYVDTENVAGQAVHVFKTVGPDTPVMWDIEKGGGNLDHLCAIHDHYTELGGYARDCYLPHWYWLSIGSPDLLPLVQRDLLLHASDYPHNGYSADGPGWQAYGHMTPTFWQWTSTPIDTNAFRGDLHNLETILAKPGTITPPAPPSAHPKPVHEVVKGDTMFSIATIWHVTLGQIERANPNAGHPAGNYATIWPGDIIHHP